MSTLDQRRPHRWAWLPSALAFALLAAGAYHYAAGAVHHLLAVLGS